VRTTVKPVVNICRRLRKNNTAKQAGSMTKKGKQMFPLVSVAIHATGYDTTYDLFHGITGLERKYH